MRKVYWLVLLLLFSSSVLAQKETNNWFFGARAGLDFNSGSPVNVTTGMLNSPDACAAISNSNGNLLFYTDGSSVWNRNHVVMPNGTNLRGDPQATQSAVIVPKPGSNDIYYIFTVDMQGGKALYPGGDKDGIASGLRYTAVDMTASAGLGAVVAAEKNVFLIDTTTEGLTAIKAANNIDYWVVAHGTNNNAYLAYLVTAAGVNPVPVVSNSGPVVFVSSQLTGAGAAGSGAVGYMKISPNRLKIGACHAGENNLVVISDFNPATGVVSNSSSYPLLTDARSFGPYGCEFSNCAEYLYVTEHVFASYSVTGSIFPKETKIWRYDLGAGNTRTQFTSIPNEYNAALQLGPDGRIYVSQNTRAGVDSNSYMYASGLFLHAINNPRFPAANLILNAASLTPRRSNTGLPNYVASFFSQISFRMTNVATGDSVNFCTADTVLFTGSVVAYDSLRWNFGDPASGINNTSTILNPRHAYLTGGTYTIRFYKYLCGQKDSVIRTINVNAYPVIKDLRDTSICTGGSILLDGTAVPVTSYSWSTGAVTPTITVSIAGKYVLSATNNGCVSKDSMNLTLLTPIPVSVSATAAQNPICSGQTDTFFAVPVAGLSGQTYQWYKNNILLPGETDSVLITNVLANNDQIKVVMTGGGLCVTGSPATSNIIVVTVRPNPNVTVNQPVICEGSPAILSANGASTYTWSGGLPNGSPVTTPPLSSSTNYLVTGTDVNGCTDTATSNISVLPRPNVTVNQPSICSGNTATLTANGASTYTWSGGLPNGASVTTPILSSTTSYLVTGTGANGCTDTATSVVSVLTAPTVSVNSPSVCSGQTATLTASGASTYTWSGGLPNGATVTTPPLVSNTTYIVTGTGANGCTDTAWAVVTVGSSLVVSVNSPTICSGTTATLTASGANTYTWSGGLPNGATVTTPVLSANTSYLVTGTDLNGCTDTATAVVTIRALPPVSVNSPTICPGDSAVLTASGATTYTWSGGLPNGSPVTTPVLFANTSYTVTGTDVNGCVNTATATVTVRAQPNVTVNSPAICTGSAANLSASGASTYTWSGGLPNGANVTTPVLSASTSYLVTGTDANGCTDTARAFVTVNPLPTVIVNSPTVCSGQPATLTASGASTYTWSGGLPNGATVTTPPLASNTSYTVTGTDANGCINTAVATVTISSAPNITVNSPTICTGETTVLTASGADSYTWSTGQSGSSISVTPSGTTSYSVTGLLTGCATPSSATSTVTVNTRPSVSVNSPTICSGATATLTASGASTYTWTGGLPNGATVTTTVLSSNTSYTVTGTAANGCTNTAVSNVTVQAPQTTNISQSICSGQSVTIGGQTFDSTGIYSVTLTNSIGCDSTVILNLTVSQLLTASVSIAANKNNICAGDAVTFTATPVNGGTTPTYQWFVNGAPAGTNSAVFTTNSLVNNDEVWVALTSSDLCAQSTAALSEKIRIQVNQIDYTKPQVIYCAGQTAILDLQIPQTGYTIEWVNGSETQTTSNTDQIELDNTVSGAVFFTIRFGNNCQIKDSVKYTVNPAPVISASVDRDRVKYEEEVSLSVSGSNAYHYSWTPSAILDNDTIKNPTAVITEPTWFSVTATDNKSCSATDSVFVDLIDECSPDYVFVPNGFSPNFDGLNDCFGVLYVPQHTEFSLVIFNRWGEKLYETTNVEDCWDGRYKGEFVLIDSYTFVVSFRCYNGQFVMKKGIVTVVR